MKQLTSIREQLQPTREVIPPSIGTILNQSYRVSCSSRGRTITGPIGNRIEVFAISTVTGSRIASSSAENEEQDASLKMFLSTQLQRVKKESFGIRISLNLSQIEIRVVYVAPGREIDPLLYERPTRPFAYFAPRSESINMREAFMLNYVPMMMLPLHPDLVLHTLHSLRIFVRRSNVRSQDRENSPDEQKLELKPLPRISNEPRNQHYSQIQLMNHINLLSK